jgi:Acetokinase family
MSCSGREAIELFTYRIAVEAGALVSALGGLDGLAFTAGIGEHSPEIRASVCARLAWLGLRLDNAANAARTSHISTPDSTDFDIGETVPLAAEIEDHAGIKAATAGCHDQPVKRTEASGRGDTDAVL